MATAVVETPVGSLLIQTSARGISRIAFADTGRGAPAPPAPEDGVGGQAVLDLARRQLEEYFAGQRHSFDLPLDLAGTDFQRRVWQAIAAIPFGETASYASIAATAGVPNAYRAAGAACGANPVVIVVPCHRVIGSDGGLHGFGGGLDTKVWLLRHEGVRSRAQSQRDLALTSA